MYNEIIASRLTQLKYLAPLKKANVTIISKSNKFGDILKFFAQINIENVIQKITYKATGCSTFLVLCDYFCEIIEGKNIDDALKVSDKDLANLTTLDQSREHVYQIILDTFKLLIKKYKKGVEKNKIIPLEVIDNKETKVENKSITKKEKVTHHAELEEILDKTNKKGSKKEKKQKEKPVKKEKIVEQTPIEIDAPKDIEEIKESITDNIEIKTIPDHNEIIIETNDAPDKINHEENVIEVKHEITVVETITESKPDKTVIEEKKTSHLMALRQKISNKENNEKAHNHASSLNSMLALMNKNKEIKTEPDKNAEIVDSTKNNDDQSAKKEKKSLFGWLKKK